ncbi:MAG: putative sulfate exporter family transporter [Bacteroidales bacterium]|nr:putative sulfate exporter family transporter [Bacteroidales bacterium]
MKKKLSFLYLLLPLLCMCSFVTAPMALFCGILLAFLKIERPFEFKKYSSPLLQYSVVLMGFGMSLQQVIEVSSKGIILTACSVLLVFLFGMLLGRLLKVDRNTAMLISSGTAICGGSAIAAVSPIIKAKDNQISFALTVVFVLNALALFIFPPIGRALNMGEVDFGYWSAIAIHDTSSVVGAGAAYGPDALQTAVTVKLARTLWIIPLSFLVLFINRKHDSNKGKIKIPWFILYFVVAILIAFLLPQFSELYTNLAFLGRRGMVVALFMIGCGFSFEDLKKAGWRSFVLGVLLWIVIAVSSFLLFIKAMSQQMVDF